MIASLHIIIVIFSNPNKRIKLIVEVDGKQHKKSLQEKRDKRKDRIINAFELNVFRIKTTDENIQDMIESHLSIKNPV